MRVHTVGHGRRPVEELVAVLHEAAVETLVDVRRYPGSRRNPQFSRGALEETLAEAGIAYVHAEQLGGHRRGIEGEDVFACIRVAAFRSYAAWMASAAFQAELDAALALPAPCLMCAETLWTRCHRRLISELLAARGHDVVHLIRPGDAVPHQQWTEADYRDGHLFLCDRLVV